MTDRKRETLGISAQWALNFLLGILVAIMGYQVVQMDKRIDEKADKEIIAMMCQRIDAKADTTALDRVEGGIQRQMTDMTIEIRGLRSDLNKYFLERTK